MTRPKPIRLLVTDVDNTLYDWVSIWSTSFDAFLNSISAISGLSREQLEEEIRPIHQRVGTSEYSFLLQDLKILANVHGTDDYLKFYGPAIAAYRDARAGAMKLYPGVRETLEELRGIGVPIVAYTESFAFHTALRFRWLELDGLVDVLYSPADHSSASVPSLSTVRSLPDDEYELKFTRHEYTPPGHFKPDPAVLEVIVRDFGEDPSSVLYVGDSLTKDIAMAQALSVRDAFAAYGVAQFRESYELLRRVSHWTDEDVERERQLLAKPQVIPSVSLDSFADIRRYFAFAPGTRDAFKSRPLPST